MKITFKPYMAPNTHGEMCMWPFNQDDAKFYRNATSAPRGTAISFELGMTICLEKYAELFESGNYQAGAEFLQDTCWATYLSTLGYHIEFSGHEFEFTSEMAA
jgi:hypothetical protein